MELPASATDTAPSTASHPADSDVYFPSSATDPAPSSVDKTTYPASYVETYASFVHSKKDYCPVLNFK